MKHKKKLSLLLALALGVTPVLTSVNQSKIFAEEKILNEDKMIEEYAKELELYFSKIGSFDKSKNYIVKNYYLLREEVKKNNPLAKALYSSNTNKSLSSFLWCVVNDQTYGVIDFIKGNSYSALVTALANGSWYAASKIIVTAMKSVGQTAGLVTSGFYTVASVAMSVYSCRNEY